MADLINSKNILYSRYRWIWAVDNIYIEALACTNMGVKYTNQDFFEQTEKYFFPKIESTYRKLYEKLLLKDPSFTRYLCEDYKGEAWERLNTKDKMIRYDHFAKIMSLSITKNLIEQAGININEIDLVVVNQTTGSTLPSISAYVLSELDCCKNTLTLNIGYMGCSAALIAIDTAARLMRSDSNIQYAMVISLEIPSVMMSACSSDTVILGNTLFGDGAAGVILRKRRSKKSIYMIESIKRTIIIAPKSLNAIKFSCGEYYYEVNLSRDIPSVASTAMKDNLHSIVPQILSIRDKIKYLCKARLNWTENIDHWAIHPGGKRILEHVQKILELTDRKMECSFHVLKQYGNMSSPTVLFVLKELLKNKQKQNDRTLAITFGSGFKCNSASLITVR